MLVFILHAAKSRWLSRDTHVNIYTSVLPACNRTRREREITHAYCDNVIYARNIYVEGGGDI